MSDGCPDGGGIGGGSRRQKREENERVPELCDHFLPSGGRRTDAGRTREPQKLDIIFVIASPPTPARARRRHLWLHQRCSIPEQKFASDEENFGAKRATSLAPSFNLQMPFREGGDSGSARGRGRGEAAKPVISEEFSG